MYDEEGNLLSEFPLAEGEYDDDGKLIQKGDFSYKYNEKDQLIEVVSNTMKTQFAYDDKDRRVYKKLETDTATEEYKYLYLEQIPIAILKNGTLHHLQIPLPPNIYTFTKFVAFETNGQTYIPIYCFPNNVSKLINKDTKETISFCIDPYACNLHKQKQITPFLFAGKEYDKETGLVYFGHRFYDPTLRTWLTADPLKQDENHFYSYCFENPLRYADPDGQFTIVIPLIDLTLGVLGKAIMKGLCLGGAAWLGATGVKKTDEYLKEKEKKKQIEEIKRAEELQRQQDQKTRDVGLQPNPPFEKKSKPGNMQKQVERRQAPKSVDRVEHGHVPNERDHIHFNDGKTLHSDGKWRRNDGRNLTRQEKDWLQQNGWEIP